MAPLFTQGGVGWGRVPPPSLHPLLGPAVVQIQRKVVGPRGLWPRCWTRRPPSPSLPFFKLYISFWAPQPPAPHSRATRIHVRAGGESQLDAESEPRFEGRVSPVRAVGCKASPPSQPASQPASEETILELALVLFCDFVKVLSRMGGGGVPT